MDPAALVDLVQLSHLIDLIYQGATDFDAWPVAMKAISEYVGAAAVLVLTPMHTRDKGGVFVSHNIAQREIEMWATRYQPEDIWTLRAIERGLTVTGAVMRDQQLVTEAEFLASPYYRQFLEPAGFGRLLCGVVFDPHDNNGMAVAVCCYRGFDQPFAETDAYRLSLLMPHLSRAMGVMFRLRDAAFRVASSRSALDRLPIGILLFGGHGEVSFANSRMKRLLDRDDGLRLRPRPGQGDLSDLIVPTSAGQQAVRTAIREAIAPDPLATEHFSRAVAVPRSDDGAPWLLNFSSLPPGNEFGLADDAPKAIAFVNDSGGALRLKEDLLRSTYDLTAAEVRLAGVIAEGLSNDDAAAELGVSVNTVKTHLQHIFVKTGCESRSKLVRLLLAFTV